ncbi:MAG: sigma-70 family RNA polymerase sigma factor [Bacteroidales bacterium]|nr:sigma-70 family RNA polymerase sigma factor [Bacteroidales bacterium]
MAAFELFYRTEYNNLRYFVSSFTAHSNLLPEDIVQESFLTFWTSRQALDPTKNIRAYLYTIAKNKTINALKFQTRFQRGTTGQKENDFGLTVLESEDLTSRIDALDMERIIDKTYDILKGHVRESFILSRKHGMTYQEIAKKLQVSEKSVERYMSTALKIFRRKLSHYIGVLLVFFGHCCKFFEGIG